MSGAANAEGFISTNRQIDRAGAWFAEVKSVVFALRRLDTGGLVHRYDSESAALAFIRDVVRVSGHLQAQGFALHEQDPHGREHRIAEGADLVVRALQDRGSL